MWRIVMVSETDSKLVQEEILKNPLQSICK